MTETQILKQLVEHFGIESLIGKLPQKEVVKALKLVTPHELANDLNLNYDELRWQMTNGSIPFPSFSLVRRAYFTFEETKEIKANWKNKLNEICKQN